MEMLNHVCLRLGKDSAQSTIFEFCSSLQIYAKYEIKSTMLFSLNTIKNKMCCRKNVHKLLDT